MQNGNAGIKDIAKALKISIGTVDRALHERPGVSAKTKARVLQMAEQLGYKPNLAAQALKLNRRLSIGAVLPKHISHFFDPLRAGIRAAAAAAVGMQVSLTFHEYPRLGVGDVEAIEKALRQHYDGIIFLPGDTRKFDPLIRKLSRSGTAMMCVGSDAPNTDRVGSVAAHAYVSGAIAAELLAHKLTHKANVAVFSGELFTLDHAEKLRGFAATLAVQAPHLTLLPALESHERPKEAYRQALTLMQSKDRPEGLYLSTANSMPVLRALDELGLLGKVQIVTTDLFQELVPLIEFGKVLATMYQRPYTQGKVAFESLLAYLKEENKPNPVIRLAPHVIFRSNLSLFSGLIIDTDEELETEFRSRKS
ncbi:LacI family DNA-binding transcriptional regulator [Granulicella mallensis]|uniref:Transcriptional regulator, LacI family n=1 Tax=Granulicella mallensis (strain ATCC BAA-1857 / DSM 23137 / MP5ACTX8) TaxID=682795 RepID=G8NTG8_GRAMM|nr:LacI family DNA-binding transcriptional regulator [Granulicella mallensis]AEU35200.1 transcriptional regulator, LacI family [Granulicella mallensis MP5ACTX8]